jgi:hypothetical protein
MRKIVFFVFFTFLAVLAFGQNLKRYTLLQGSYEELINPGIRRFAVTGGRRFQFNPQISSDKSVYFGVEGPVVFLIELSTAQAAELSAIEEAEDEPLVLFTRRGRNRDAYTFTADRLIPFKEIFGVKSSELPRSLIGWQGSRNMIEIIQLYLNTGKTDPDGRVAGALAGK